MPRLPPGAGSCATSQAQPTQTHTRANQCTDNTLMHDNLVKMDHDSISSMEQAQDYLEKQGYAPPDTHGGKAALSYTLWLLAHCAPSTILPKALRAVAILLEHELSADTADTIVATRLHKLNPMLHLMDHMADTMQEAMEDTRKAADHLYRTGEETRDAPERHGSHEG